MANLASAFNRGIHITEVRVDGYTRNLGPTEVALINFDNYSSKGYKALKDLNGVGRDTLLKFRVGVPYAIQNNKAFDNKDISTISFTKGDIKNIRVGVPQDPTIKADIWRLGYNGKKGTGIKMTPDTTASIGIALSGEPIRMAGYPDGRVVLKEQIFGPRVLPSSDNFVQKVEFASLQEKRTNHEIVKEAIERMKEKPMANGQRLKDFVDIKLVTSEQMNPETVPNKGVGKIRIVVPFGDRSLAEQTQVKGLYDYINFEIDQNYTGVNSVAYLLTVSKEVYDTVASTKDIVKSMFNVDGCTTCSKNLSYVTRITSTDNQEITDVATFVKIEGDYTVIEGAGNKNEVFLLSETRLNIEPIEGKPTEIGLPKALQNGCYNDDANKITFKAKITKLGINDILLQKFSIVLPNLDCEDEEDRVEELVKYYGEGVLNITSVATELPCQTEYIAEVAGSPVNQECDGHFTSLGYEVSPRGFAGFEWRLIEETEYKEETEVGIIFTGGTISMNTERPYSDNKTPIFYGFTAIDIWADDEENNLRYSENFDTVQPFRIEQLQRGSNPDGLGYEYLQEQVADQNYWRGEVRIEGNEYFNRTFGLETSIKPNAVYYNYYVEIRRDSQEIFSQGGQELNLRFIVEAGQHKALESLLNNIAEAVGLEKVFAEA